MKRIGSPYVRKAWFLSTTVGVLFAGTIPASAVLDEIIVSAQKREQSIQDVPISIKVVDGEAVDRFNISTFEELDSFIPNFNVADTPGNNEIYIRGIGSQSGNLAFEQSVSMFIDGVYGGRGRLFQTPFLDVERIEVLRGPQGALVGKNTSAGAISIITRKPGDEQELSVTGEYEFVDDSFSVTGIASAPVTDRFAARVAVKYDNIGGYMENQTLGDDEPQRENWAARFTGVLEASDTVTLTGKVEYSDFRIDGTPFETVTIGQAPDYIKEADDTLLEELDETQSLLATVTADISLNDFTLKSITGYGLLDSKNFVDSDFSAAPNLASTFFDDYEQISQELRLVSPTGGLVDYIVGALYLHQTVDITRQTIFSFGPFDGTSNRNYSQKSDVISVYGQATWNIREYLRLTGSLRYTYEEKSATLMRPNTGILPPSVLGASLSASRSENQVDPSVNIQWDVVPDVMLYASFARGSKGGGFAGASSGATAANFEFEDETATSYEIGAKTGFWDGRATLNIAGFFTKYKDLQLSQFNGVSFDFGNAAEAESKGVELEALVSPVDGVTFSGALAYLDAEYTSFPNGPCIAPDHTIPGCVADISGADLVHAPTWSGNLALDVERPLVNSIVWRANLSVGFRSDEFVHPTLFDDAVQDAHAKVDLRFALGDNENHWEVAVIGRNIFDKETISHAFETPFSAPPGATPDHTSVTKLVDEPRTVAVQGTLRF